MTRTPLPWILLLFCLLGAHACVSEEEEFLTDVEGASAADDKVQPLSVPLSHGVVDGSVIQAEDFDATPGSYYDSDGVNRGESSYRAVGGVDLIAHATGHALGHIEAGEQWSYRVEVEEAHYDVSLRVASQSSVRGQLALEAITPTKTVALGTVSIPHTGGWRTWQDMVLRKMAIPRSTTSLRLKAVGGGGFNIDSFSFKRIDGGQDFDPGAWYTLEGIGLGAVLDSDPLGKLVVSQKGTNRLDQSFRFVPQGQGTYLIVNGWSGRGVLDTGSSGEVGWVPETTSSDTDKLWRILKLGDGSYRFDNQAKGRGYLDVTGGGSAVRWRPQGDFDGTRWRVQKVGGTPPVAQGSVVLPVEVFGKKDDVAQVDFDLKDAGGIDALWVQCHRCGYRDSGLNQARGAKGSVSLNGGAWVDLSDKGAKVETPEALYGGIAGSWHTVRFQVPVKGAVAGKNSLRFRFNGTDGFSGGYRIVAFNLMAKGKKVLSQETFTLDDPTLWKPPLPGTSDVKAGAALWHGSKALVHDPITKAPIKASCAGCHAEDGRDLKYFNYSNHSIETRAQFHGLSVKEGQQIASYIRSLTSPAPPQARPWNPPYQPGPGLDALPVEQWAAGAGLGAVLAEDRDMLPYLFPQGTSPQAIKNVASTRRTLNVREMPIALQLPDWNAWLPEVHPVEVWGDQFWDLEVYKAHTNALKALEGGGANRLRTQKDAIAKATLIEDVLDPMRKEVGRFTKGGGPQPCRNTAVHTSPGFKLLGYPGQVPTRKQWGDPKVCEEPLRAITHWSSVKHWEVMQRFGLEDVTKDVYPWGEARGWPGGERQVFELAPHRIGNDSYTFAHLTKAQGSYFNTAWYQLQVVLNAGNRNPLSHWPPDWKYQMDHLFLAAKDNNHPQGLRYIQTLIKMSQNLDMRQPLGATSAGSHFPYLADRGPTSRGWWLTHVIPWRFVSIGGSFFYIGSDKVAFWDAFDTVEPGLQLKLQNALLEQWLDKTETYAPADFPRGQGQGNVPPVDYVPTPYSGKGMVADSATIADGIYRTIPFLRDEGVSEVLIERLRKFGAAMWPKGNWNALKP